jgi:hypothetical protein
MLSGFPHIRCELSRFKPVMNSSWLRQLGFSLKRRLSSNLNRSKSFKYMQWSFYDIYACLLELIDMIVAYMSQTIFRRIVVNISLRIPFTVFYYCNLFIPMLISRVIYSIILSAISVLCKRSMHVRRMCVTAKALHESIVKSILKVSCMKISELIIVSLKFIYDFIKTAFFTTTSSSIHETTLSFGDIVYYEESEAQASWEPVRNRMKKLMHQYVPPNNFRVTVRLRPERSTGTSSEVASTYHTGYTTEAEIALDADSPMSFPTTPLSRARVLNRSTERVSSVMFAARDKLRLDELTFSRDELSRQAAIEARDRGKYAALDPSQASEGLALTCGNHCAFKICEALCCSSRAMIPIRRGAYTYFEFSITASHEAVPMVSVGIAPQVCPLNVMVGTWATSIGLYTDGQVLVESKWYRSSKQLSLDAGVTVGLLVYLPTRDQTSNAAAAGMGFRSHSHPILPDNSAGLPHPFFGGHSSFIQYNVNGTPMDLEIPSSFLKKLDDCSSDIYPTISVLSEGTRVWCRFSEADIVYRSRRALRAPPIVKIYCLDGSRLLNDSE